ncbi:MAG: Na-translocating system protein MpsB [Actinomycetia bacterium]|nr:Na-translocating system protein MpsB [Actinomycetes bacterium]
MMTLRVLGWTLYTLAACVLAGLVAVAIGGPVTLRPLGFDAIALRLDLASAVLLVLILGVGAVVAAYSTRQLAGEPRVGQYAAGLAGAVFGLTLAVTALALPLLWIGWVAATWSLIALVGWRHLTDAARRPARYVAAWLAAGDLILLGGLISLAVATGTTDRGELSTVVAEVSGPQIAAIAALLAAAGVIRSALLPAHRWLPETAAAPTPVSALLHAGIVNGAGVLAVLLWPVFAAAPVVLAALVLIGAASILVATAIAAVRPDVKGRLAASTSAQMGFMTIQVGLGAPAAALFHLIGHGFYKATLFLGAGSGINALRRSRTSPADASPQQAGRVRVAVSALVPTAVVIAVATTVTPPLHGVGTVVFYAAAIATAAVLIYRAIDPAFQTPFGLRAAAVVGVAGLLTTYVLALSAFESALTPVIGATGFALPAPVMLVLVSLLLGLGLLGVVVDRRARSGRAPAIVVRAVAAAMSPRGGKRLAVPTNEPTAPITPVERARARASVAAASEIVAPAWPLGQFVASNPLAGLEHLPFEVATQRAAGFRGGAVALSTTHYQRLYAAREISDTALVTAILERIDTLPVPPMLPRTSLVDLTRDMLVTTEAGVPGELQDAARAAVMSLGSRVENLLHDEGATMTVAGRTDRDRGTTLNDQIADAVAAWLAYLLADDDVRWSAPKGPLFSRWRTLVQTVAVDRSMRADGFAAAVAALPERSDESVALLLASMDIGENEWSEYLAATFARLPGWASHVAWLERESGSDAATLLDLAAIHLSVERLIVPAGPSADSADSSAAGSLRANVSDGFPATTERAVAHLERVARSGALDAASLGALDDVSLITLLRYADGVHQAAPRIWRGAHEASFRDPLVAELAGRARAHPLETESGPDVQAVFCIDVRSEPLRRQLEAAGSVQTLGFAGFFAVPFVHTSLAAACGTAQCPVLLTPRHGIHEVAGPQHHAMAHRALTGARAWRQISASTTAAQKAPNAPYSFAEAAGWLLAPMTLLRTASPRGWFRLRRATRDMVQPRVLTRQTIDETRDGLGFSPDEQLFLAEAALRTMGLTRDFARLVMISGHGSHTENNPFEAAYDCGACGGNPGAVNARALATILNSGVVRGRLAQVGINIPDATWFLPAEHDTTVDTVTLLDADQVPTSHWRDVAELRVMLDCATLSLSEQRIRTLPNAPQAATPAAARRHVERRAADWAQTRPEWGLAGNAAFIIGDRSITEGCDLGGRAFLHSYLWQDDEGGAALEVILTAPMVVAEWINTQYYFSSVDPDHFGSGSKVLHNLVGRIGVLSGPRGDLKPGLPLQAVAERVDGDGVHLRHQPLRLMTVIQAPLERVAAVVARNPVLQALFGNEWVSLVVLDPATSEPQRYLTGGKWRPWFANTAQDSEAVSPAVDLSHPPITTIGATR